MEEPHLISHLLVDFDGVHLGAISDNFALEPEDNFCMDISFLLIFFFNFYKFIHFILWVSVFTWMCVCAPHEGLVPGEVRRGCQVP